MKTHQKMLLGINLTLILGIFILNYFYQLHGFDFALKCICSGAFALLGLVNLVYGLIVRRQDGKFLISMSSGLVLAFLGDVLIAYDFIIGAATFALGHLCFVVAYCFLQKIRPLDLLLCGLLFAGGGCFLLFCPLLTFEEPLFRWVCLAYALIISAMLGKALGNFVKKRSLPTAIMALASVLFFFSDLMLVLDWFIGRWNWTDHACMASYYPALCLLAFSMLLFTLQQKITAKK